MTVARAFSGIRGAFWRCVALLTMTDTTLAEFQSSTTLIAMGVLMLDPWPTLPGLGSRAVQLHMVSLMSEHQWGILFFGFGLLQSIANLARASYPRQLLAFMASCIFGLMAALGAISKPAGFFLPVFGVAALVQALVYLRVSIARDVRENCRKGGSTNAAA